MQRPTRVLFSIAAAHAVFLVFFVAPPAFAQGLRGRLFVGALYDPVFHVTDETSNAGAHFDVSQNIIEKPGSSISWVGEFGFNSFENETITGYLGGGRIAGQINPRMALFFQFLAGAQHCCDSTDFAFQPGLGFDFARWPNITIRTQLDFRRVFFESNSRSETRLGVGVAIPLRIR
jgi:hypothetical protein